MIFSRFFRFFFAIVGLFFLPLQSLAFSFTDTSDIPQWGVQAVNTVQTKKIMTGFSDGTFRPNQFLNRAETLAILFRAKNIDYQSNQDKNIIFSDIPEDAWYLSLVREGIKQNIIHGFPDGTFRAENFVTKAEFAVFVKNVYGLQRLDNKDTFTFDDIPSNDWYSEAVYDLYDNGLVRIKNSSFHPQDPMTRVEAAWIVSEIISKPRLTGESKTNDFSLSQKRNTRQVAIKPRNLKSYKQGYDIPKKNIVVVAEPVKDTPTLYQPKAEWTTLGSFHFANHLDASVELQSFDMKLKFEKSNIGPVSNFKIQILQGKTIYPLSVGLGGDIFLGGLQQIIRTGEEIFLEVQIAPLSQRTFFADIGKGTFSIEKISATLMANPSSPENNKQNYRFAPWQLGAKDLPFSFALKAEN